jgi:hypothetical protein
VKVLNLRRPGGMPAGPSTGDGEGDREEKRDFKKVKTILMSSSFSQYSRSACRAAALDGDGCWRGDSGSFSSSMPQSDASAWLTVG